MVMEEKKVYALRYKILVFFNFHQKQSDIFCHLW